MFSNQSYSLDTVARLPDDVCFQLVQTIESFTARSLRVLESRELRKIPLESMTNFA